MASLQIYLLVGVSFFMLFMISSAAKRTRGLASAEDALIEALEGLRQMHSPFPSKEWSKCVIHEKTHFAKFGAQFVDFFRSGYVPHCKVFANAALVNVDEVKCLLPSLMCLRYRNLNSEKAGLLIQRFNCMINTGGCTGMNHEKLTSMINVANVLQREQSVGSPWLQRADTVLTRADILLNTLKEVREAGFFLDSPQTMASFLAKRRPLAFTSLSGRVRAAIIATEGHNTAAVQASLARIVAGVREKVALAEASAALAIVDAELFDPSRGFRLLVNEKLQWLRPGDERTDESKMALLHIYNGVVEAMVVKGDAVEVPEELSATLAKTLAPVTMLAKGDVWRAAKSGSFKSEAAAAIHRDGMAGLQAWVDRFLTTRKVEFTLLQAWFSQLDTSYLDTKVQIAAPGGLSVQLSLNDFFTQRLKDPKNSSKKENSSYEAKPVIKKFLENAQFDALAVRDVLDELTLKLASINTEFQKEADPALKDLKGKLAPLEDRLRSAV